MIKRLLYGVGAAVLLLLLSALVLPFLFRDRIEAALKEEINRQLLADVDWESWHFSLLRRFPNMTVGVRELRVTNRAPFEGLELAYIGEFSLTLDLFSLWRERWDVLELRLDDPRIQVRVLEDGQANYLITRPSEEGESSSSPFHLALKRYAIQGAELHYEDEAAGLRAILEDLDHEGSGDFTQERFTLRTRSQIGALSALQGGIAYLNKARVNLEADVEADLPGARYTLSQNTLRINELELGLEGWVAMPGEGYAMDLAFASRRSDLAGILSLVPAAFTRDLKGVSMSGSTAFEGRVQGVYRGEELPAFALQTRVENGSFQYPSLPERAEDIQLDLSLDYPGGADLDRLVLDLRQLRLKLAGNPLEARLRLTRTQSDPLLDAALKTAMDLASLQRVVPLQEALSGRLDADLSLAGALSDLEGGRYDRFEASGEASLRGMELSGGSLAYPVQVEEARLVFNPRFLQLEPFRSRIGSSDLSLTGRLDNYLQWWLRDELLRGSLNLNAGRIDLNELASAPAPAAEQGAGEGSAAPQSAGDEEPREADQGGSLGVIRVPAGLDLSLNASIAELLYDNLVLQQLSGQLQVRDEQLDLRELSFSLFGGMVSVSGSYDTRNPGSPAVDLNYDVRNLDIARTAEAIATVDRLAPVARHATGRFNTRLQLQAVLDERMQPVLNSIRGSGSLSSKQLRIQGFEPLTRLADVLRIKELQSTTIQDVFIGYEIEDGMVQTRPFDLDLNGVLLSLGGSMGMIDQALDYQLSGRIPVGMFGASPEQSVGSLLGLNQQALSALAMPEYLNLSAAVGGTVKQPEIRPVFQAGNISSAVREAVDQAVDEAVETVRETVDQAKADAIARAEKERDRLIAEAQRQADQIKAEARTQAAKVKEAAYKAADAELAKVKNPLARAAADKVADKAKAEADKKEQQSIAEADRRADALVEAARRQGDDLVRKAEQSGP
jgi:uncharacterized protein involved in outer membrane biogenesis